MVIRGKGGNKIGKETTFFLSHWKRNHLQTLHVGAQVSSSLMGLALAGFLGRWRNGWRGTASKKVRHPKPLPPSLIYARGMHKILVLDWCILQAYHLAMLSVCWAKLGCEWFRCSEVYVYYFAVAVMLTRWLTGTSGARGTVSQELLLAATIHC